ncbi:MAG: hypothetical protein RL150_592 [Candidatus Parcubacteria bacterium]|jgi:hypothetical protein
MISQETENLIKEQFNTLPPVVQDIVLNSNWQEKVRNIVEKYQLHIDQGAALESLIFVTMLGMEDPDAFVENAKEGARVSDEQAAAIAADIERDIFGNIREKLVGITESHDTIDDVERVSNELTKADDDIAAAVKEDNEVTLPSKGSTARYSTKKLDVSPVALFQGKPIPQSKPILLAGTPAPHTAVPAHIEKVITLPTTPKTAPQMSPAPIVKTQPAPPLAAVKQFVPKHLDPIVAAKLGQPVTAAKNRLELETSESTVSGEASPATPTTRTYGSTDPYREPIA